MSEANPEPEAQATATEAESNKPKADKQPKAEKPKDKKSKDKRAKDDKGKGKGKGKGKAGASGGLSIANHPRAGAQVRRAKGWGGLGAFGIAAYLSSQVGVPFTQIVLRALAAGVAGYMVAWACSLTIWRYLVLAELRAMSERQDSSSATAGTIPAAGGTDARPTLRPGR